MPRRVNLPGASELFRGTDQAARTSPAEPAQTPNTDPAAALGPSGRVRHDEKITVYVSSEELFGLERARLDLRALHGLAADRGRLVREAIDMALADFEHRGADSELVRRLGQT